MNAWRTGPNTGRESSKALTGHQSAAEEIGPAVKDENRQRAMEGKKKTVVG